MSLISIIYNELIIFYFETVLNSDRCTIVNMIIESFKNEQLCYYQPNSPHLLMCIHSLQCGHDVCLRCFLDAIVRFNFHMCPICFNVTPFELNVHLRNYVSDYLIYETLAEQIRDNKSSGDMMVEDASIGNDERGISKPVSPFTSDIINRSAINNSLQNTHGIKSISEATIKILNEGSEIMKNKGKKNGCDKK